MVQKLDAFHTVEAAAELSAYDMIIEETIGALGDLRTTVSDGEVNTSHASPDTVKPVSKTTETIRKGLAAAMVPVLSGPVAAQAPKPQPAIVEVQDVAGTKQQLDAFLLSRKLERFGPQFEALSKIDQAKVLSYFLAGKKEQPDEKILGKGVVNYIVYLAQVIENDKIIKYYEANHQLPKKSDAAGSLAGYAKFIIAAFPGADRYADMSACEQIDNLIVGWYDEKIARSQANIAHNEAESARSQANIAKMQEEIAKMQEEIALYKRLLGRK